jgi:hypothetical protein
MKGKKYWSIFDHIIFERQSQKWLCLLH